MSYNLLLRSKEKEVNAYVLLSLVLHQLFSRANGASSVEEAEISLFISANRKESKRINIIKSEFQKKSEKEILSPLFIFSSLFPEITLNHGFQHPTHSYFFHLISP